MSEEEYERKLSSVEQWVATSFINNYNMTTYNELSLLTSTEFTSCIKKLLLDAALLLTAATAVYTLSIAALLYGPSIAKVSFITYIIFHHYYTYRNWQPLHVLVSPAQVTKTWKSTPIVPFPLIQMSSMFLKRLKNLPVPEYTVGMMCIIRKTTRLSIHSCQMSYQIVFRVTPPS